MSDNDAANPDKQRRKPTTARIRRQEVIGHALAGKSNKEIISETGLAPQTVSEMLNSQEMKTILNRIDKQLMSIVDDAIRTVAQAVKVDYGAARDVLRNFGSMRIKTEVELSGRVTLEQLVMDSMSEEVEK